MSDTGTDGCSGNAPPSRLGRRAAIKQILGFAAGAVTAAGFSHALAPAGASGDSSAPADLGMALSDEQRAAGVSFLKRHVSADIHCHPGRFFLSGLPPGTPAIRALGEPFEERAISELQAGNVSAGLFAAVSDLRLLEVTPAGIHSNRDFQAGEALADYQRQLSELKAFAAKRGLAKGLSIADVDQAHRHHETAAVFAIEGGDFIEDRLDRVHMAFADGVRAITIVHYHVNQ